MEDEAWLALNIFMEARGEPQDGQAAVGLVTMNRAHLKFFAPAGTIPSAVQAKDQFSWLWFDMENGKYSRVCSTQGEALIRAARLYEEAQKERLAWAQCEDVAGSLLKNLYYGGPAYSQLTPATVLYYNPDSIRVPPAWALPRLLDARIGHHLFYHTDVTLKEALEAGGLSHPLLGQIPMSASAG